MQDTTNRQDNRFADAYIEPRYFDPPNKGKPLTSPHEATLTGKNSLNGTDQNLIADAMNTKDVGANKTETDMFWVAYIGGGWSLPGSRGIMGLTNFSGGKKYDWSIVFDENIAKLLADFPAKIPTATAKVAIHEIGHQLLRPNLDGRDNDGHRGVEDDVTSYYNALPNGKTGAAWAATVNIMNRAALQVPMDDPTASLVPVGGVLGDPTVNTVVILAGNTAGPYDRFYFSSKDIVSMRSRRHSPGRD